MVTSLLIVLSFSENFQMPTLDTRVLLLKVRGSFAAKMARVLKKRSKFQRKLLTHQSSLFTWTTEKGPLDFKLASEILEHRRVYVYRRWILHRQLAVISSHVAKRRRKMFGNHRSTSLFANMMKRQVEREDQACERLLTKCVLKNKEINQHALRLLKMARAKLSLMSGKIAKTNKFKAWRQGMLDFWKEMKDVFDLKTVPWTHSSHVTARLKAALVQMEDHETTTCRGWQQLEIRSILTTAMTLLFWD